MKSASERYKIKQNSIHELKTKLNLSDKSNIREELRNENGNRNLHYDLLVEACRFIEGMISDKKKGGLE